MRGVIGWRDAGLAVVVAMALLLGLACGGGSSSSPTGTTKGTATVSQKSSGTSGTPRSDVDELTASAKEYSFTLSLTSVRPGAPGVDVTFKNEGTLTHTLTFYADSGYQTKVGGSGNIAAGQTGGFPFIPPDGATKLYYRCDIHTTQMKGEIAVAQ